MSLEQARADMTQAVTRYAMLEVPAGIALGGVLAYLFGFDNGLDDNQRTTWAIVAVLAFAAYGLALVFTVILPSARRVKAANEAGGRGAGS